MDALRAYGGGSSGSSSSSSSGSGSSSGSSSGSDLDKSDQASKRQRLCGGGPAYAAVPEVGRAAAAAAASLLPSAAALLEGSYSPPPLHKQRQLERALHGGRARTFPHVEGSFATHVYLAVATPPGCQAALESLLQLLSLWLPGLQPAGNAASSTAGHPQGANTARMALPPPSALLAPVGSRAPVPPAPAAVLAAAPTFSWAQAEYHVSLSRTVALRRDQIEPLLQALRQQLRHQEAFSVCMGQPEVFVNDEGTRTFLSLAAGSGGGASAGEAGAGEAGSSGGGDGGGCASASEAGSGGGASAGEAGSPGGDGSSDDGGGSSGGRPEQQQQAHQQGADSLQQQGVDGLQQQQQQRPGGQQRYCRQLVSLCHAVSRVFAAHGLPRFYEGPRPHASVAWLLGHQQQQLDTALRVADVQAAAGELAAQRWQLRPAAIVCKAGQREHTIWQAAESPFP